MLFVKIGEGLTKAAWMAKLLNFELNWFTIGYMSYPALIFDLTNMGITYLQLFTAVFSLFLLIDIIFFIFILKIRKRNKILFEGKKAKNLEEAFLNQVQKNKDQDAEIKELFERVKELEKISERTYQKVGIVRFNPFSGMGGNQSFVIALLDNQNNGFVISSLFIKENNRFYAKSIKKGLPEYSLSEEEKEALEKAINFKI